MPRVHASLLRGQAAPAARRLVSVVLIVALIAIGGLALVATWVAALLALIVACCLALDLTVARMSAEDPCLALDLSVACMSAEDPVLRHFRRQLAALPETVHPQGY